MDCAPIKMKDYIANTIKKNYVKPDQPQLYDYKIDCGDGINILQVSEDLVQEIRNFDLEWLREYPHTADLKPAVVAYWQSIAPLSPSGIFFTGGTMRAIKVACRLFLEPGDKVLGCIPTFSAGESEVKLWGATYDGVYASHETGYGVDMDALLERYTPEHKLVYIDNPNNPTGYVIPIDQIERLVAKAAQDGTGVIIDEAYGDFMPKENSAISLIPKYDNLIMLRSFSKGFGIAGMRIGYMVCGKALEGALFKITEPYGVGVLSRRLATACLRPENDFLSASLTLTKQVKHGIVSQTWQRLQISQTGAQVPIMVLRHPNPEIALDVEFAKHGIKVVAGTDFTGLEQNTVRFRVPRVDELQDVIAVMQEIDAIP